MGPFVCVSCPDKLWNCYPQVLENRFTFKLEKSVAVSDIYVTNRP